MLAELDETGNQTRTYTLGNEYAGQSVVNPLNNSLTSENKAASYFITDEQGSIRYILDQSGEVLNFYQYSAFGETVTAEESIPNHLRNKCSKKAAVKNQKRASKASYMRTGRCLVCNRAIDGALCKEYVDISYMESVKTK